jgi:hypothetical protein
MDREVATYLGVADPELRWGLLPERLRGVLGSEAEWLRALRAHFISVQSEWKAVLGGEEAAYYADMLTASREKGMLYPYHLARQLANQALRMKDAQHSPFDYYVEMIVERMRSDRSYDTIPSFTAADCVRLVQCGRNEFIHALNNCRSKGWLWKRRRALIAKQLPPAPPLDLRILHWWEVHPTRAAAGALAAAAAGGRARGPARSAAIKRASNAIASFAREAAGGAGAGGVSAGVSSAAAAAAAAGAEEAVGEDEEYGSGAGVAGVASADGALSTVEAEALALIAGSLGPPLLAGMLPSDALRALHAGGLVRFTVPMSEADRIAVPPLTGFVMNRVGNDYLEKLLYELFVSNDESSSLGGLAELLDQPPDLVARAASIACRLGFAKKLTAPPLSSAPPRRAGSLAAAPDDARDARDAPPPPPGGDTAQADRFVVPAPFGRDANNRQDGPAAGAAVDVAGVGPAEPTLQWHPSWLTDADSAEVPGLLEGGGRGSGGASPDSMGEAAAGEGEGGGGGGGGGGVASQRVALLVDSKMSACLMMSNLADELKQHAVTLYARRAEPACSLPHAQPAASHTPSLQPPTRPACSLPHAQPATAPMLAGTRSARSRTRPSMPFLAPCRAWSGQK